MITEVAVLGWAVMAFLWCIIELKTPGLFYSLSFALGAGVAGISAWYQWAPEEQMTIFLGASFIAFFFLKLCVGVIHKAVKNLKTNVDALPGKQGVVTRMIPSGKSGQVQVEGSLWSAREVHDQEVKNGASIVVERVEGVRLIVRKA